jgi:CubicO group peptidase (beta-lactamase class C family)
MWSAGLLALLLATTQGPAATPELERWLEDVRQQAHLPGLAVVIVAADGQTSFVALGHDAENAPVTPQTPFALGSLSKSVTAMAAMVLVERGALALDQPASSVVRELDPRITVKQLLHQTSGLPGSAGFWLSGGTLEARVQSLAGVGLHAPPGERFQYSNANYDALGLIIERVAKKPYARFVREDVLAPLGIDGLQARAERAAVPDGHQDWFGLFAVPRAADEWNEANTPAGGYFASAEGLAPWLRLHLLEGRGFEPVVLSESGFRTLHTAGTDEASSYAMGWTARTLEGQPMILHSGQTGEFTSTMALFPQSGVAIAALANVNAFQSPATRLTVRDIVPNVARLLWKKEPSTSSVFGFRNQPASKWLFLGVALFSLLRLGMALRRRRPRPRWHAGLDALFALALIFGVPVLANVPLAGMARFNPDLVALLALGAVGTLVRAGTTLFPRPAS